MKIDHEDDRISTNRQQKMPVVSNFRHYQKKKSYLYSFQNRKEEITFDFSIFIAIAAMYRIFTK